MSLPPTTLIFDAVFSLATHHHFRKTEGGSAQHYSAQHEPLGSIPSKYLFLSAVPVEFMCYCAESKEPIIWL